MPTSPEISVIIPCYNAEPWVARAIQSVLDQNGVKVEIIAIDDGSGDGSFDVIRSFGDAIKCASVPNGGGCAARNFGLEISTAPYVHFLDADDYIEGNFLADGLMALKKESAHFAIGNLCVETRQQRRKCYLPVGKHWQAMLRELLLKGSVQQASMIFEKQLVFDAGRWSVDLSRYQDLEFVVRILTKGPRVTSWSSGSAVWVQHGSISRLSARRDIAAVSSQIISISRTRRHLIRSGFAESDADALVANRAYRVWRAACAAGDAEAIAKAHEFWSEVGGGTHLGSLAHVIAASVLGLRTKERLAVRFAAWRRRSLRRPAGRA